MRLNAVRWRATGVNATCEIGEVPNITVRAARGHGKRGRISAASAHNVHSLTTLADSKSIGDQGGSMEAEQDRPMAYTIVEAVQRVMRQTEVLT